ncbi:MAG: membrane dipeptidase, partial [Clostridia bacterium]|nr:membrane dipeptidase [Clostridia bacterium]
AKKVMISHTAFNGVFKHKRNVSDGLIIDVISKGGIIGLTLVGYFLTLKSATIYDVIKHIDYFTSKFGEDNLCIGTDYNGTNYLPKGLTKYTHFITLKEELLKLGYKEETVNKIFYYNAYNYFSAK